MEYTVRDGFREKKGVVSNTHGFLQTYMDGGFKEKWSGYWSPSHKYLDYFAVKVNGVWLTEETLQEVRYGKEILQVHRVSSLEIRQKITCPDDLPGFKLNYEIRNDTDENKAVRASIETGVDIRPRTEDVGGQNYSVEAAENKIKILKDDKWISIRGEKFSFVEDSYIKEHFPGERQECLVPGEIFSRCEIEPETSEEAEIVFRTDGDVQENPVSPEGTLSHSEIGEAFDYSIESLENLYYGKNGAGVIAGHPWFQNYWARDSFWTALGMIDAGMFEEVEKLLLNFAERKDFPSKIYTDGGVETEYPRSDSIPLFAIAVDQLDSYYDADRSLLDRAEELLTEERPMGKTVGHHPDGTWMDTLQREKAVDIQSLWIEALERFDRGTRRLRNGLEEFKEDEYVKDNLGDDFESINPAVSLMFGHVDEVRAEKYLEKINGEFSSRYGARTRSVTDHGYDPSGYHTGSVWGLTTCWAAAANLNYGKRNHGVNFLKKFSQFLDRNQLGALPEVVDAEKGGSLGCDEQAWSAGLYVHVVDSYLLGIEVEDGKLVIDPVGEVSLQRKGKRIGGNRVDISVEDGEAEILNSPEIEVEVR